MPELPEVETVRRGLEPWLTGAKLSDVRLHRRNLRYDFPTDFAQRLDGAEVLRLERRAKYILAWLDTHERMPKKWPPLFGPRCATHSNGLGHPSRHDRPLPGRAPTLRWIEVTITPSKRTPNTGTFR